MGKTIGDYMLMEYENFHGYSSDEISDFMESKYENFHNVIKNDEENY